MASGLSADDATPSGTPSPPKRVLAVASGGGHWIQLLRLAPAFDDQDVAYLSVEPGYQGDVGAARYYVVVDANQSKKLSLVRQLLAVLWVLVRERPDIVLSTGASVGYFAVRLSKLFGARTVWIDSIANAKELSLSGKMVGKYADLWLTQWPAVARPDGPQYLGSVL